MRTNYHETASATKYSTLTAFNKEEKTIVTKQNDN